MPFGDSLPVQDEGRKACLLDRGWGVGGVGGTEMVILKPQQDGEERAKVGPHPWLPGASRHSGDAGRAIGFHAT